jgi:septal ring factor EnvC (AmiA/AmiB activator)
LKGWGQVLILRLNGGYRIVLAGLDEVNAGVGRSVAAGEPVGRMGTAPGTELYLEMRRGAEAIDPAPWLQGPRHG